MKLQAYHWLFTASLLAALHATYGWGSVGLVPDVGTVVEHSAQREGALTWTYLNGGRKWIELVGWQESARKYGEALVAPLRPQLLATPALAMDLLHGAPATFNQRLLQWSHWGTPLALVFALIAYVRRQKEIVTTRRLR